MSDVDVELMCLSRAEYADVCLESGTPLSEIFSEQVYVLGVNGMSKILEIAPEMTPAMRDLFPDWPEGV